MGIFMKKTAQNKQLSQRELLAGRYNSARMDLLIVVAMTVLNIVLLVTNGDTYFLFSAFIPYFIVSMGMLLCGKYPLEIYTEDLADIAFYDNSFLIVTIVIAAVIVLFYLLSWIFSKNKVGWLIFALVFFSVDTLGMIALSGIDLENLLDVVLHALVLFYLGSGVHAYYKLKNLPEEEAIPAEVLPEEAIFEEATPEQPDIVETTKLNGEDM